LALGILPSFRYVSDFDGIRTVFKRANHKLVGGQLLYYESPDRIGRLGGRGINGRNPHPVGIGVFEFVALPQFNRGRPVFQPNLPRYHLNTGGPENKRV